MKSIETQLTEAQASLLEKGVKFATIQGLTEGGTLEQKLSRLKEYTPQTINRKNGQVQESINESVAPSQVKLLETLIRNGYSEPEAKIMAGIGFNPNQTTAERKFLRESETWSE
jgi:hypothetical protein